MTVQEALAKGSADLRASGADSPALDASLLLAEALHTSRSALFAAGPQPVPEEALAAFHSFLARRQAGECTAYILGRKEFWGLEFTVNPAALCPRPDTETLVEAALETLAGMDGGAPPRILDLCTGSGAVAVAVKHERPGALVWASDVSGAALDAARINVARLLPGPQPAVTLLQGDLFAALDCAALEGFDLITANPPYVPCGIIPSLPPEVRFEPVLALDGGEDGLALIRRIIAGAGAYLRPGGALLLEADPAQMGAIRGLLDCCGFRRVRVWPDLAGRERVAGVNCLT
ncbi:MAG: peptide chain release factor N(5)-glutamine methyltransferase [Treponema sp.]|jgi:release factor glutamine methyltransferase|nr:peptide chain release factor N(5)-glutamine methyltransferase [Treponema sp.]